MTIQEFIKRKNIRPRSYCRNRYELVLDALDARLDPSVNLESRSEFLKEAGIILCNNFTGLKMAQKIFEDYDFERVIELASPGAVSGISDGDVE